MKDLMGKTVMPARPGEEMKCEPWCGRGCTKGEYEDALSLAKKIVKALGPDFKPYLIHNMGWYPSAVSKCKRIKVHYNTPSRYTAFLGEPGPGGKWVENARTPKAAVRKVIAVARQDMERLWAIIKNLPYVGK